MQLRFAASDQSRFAELSGDHNPIHVDPVAARRLLFGRPVVHGVHVVLKSLDRLPINEVPGGVTARFVSPVFADAELTLTSKLGKNGIDLTISDRVGPCAIIALEAGRQLLAPGD